MRREGAVDTFIFNALRDGDLNKVVQAGEKGVGYLPFQMASSLRWQRDEGLVQRGDPVRAAELDITWPELVSVSDVVIPSWRKG